VQLKEHLIFAVACPWSLDLCSVLHVVRLVLHSLGCFLGLRGCIASFLRHFFGIQQCGKRKVDTKKILLFLSKSPFIWTTFFWPLNDEVKSLNRIGLCSNSSPCQVDRCVSEGLSVEMASDNPGEYSPLSTKSDTLIPSSSISKK
jgi:hypothetical protein